MANQTQDQQTYFKIDKLINSSRFNEAFLLLKSQIQQYPDLTKAYEKLLNDEKTYQFMLDFIAEGHQEPSRNEVIEQIRDTLFITNEMILRQSRLKDSADIYSSTRRMFKLKGTQLKDLFENFKNKYEEDNEKELNSISPEQEAALNEVFNYIWTLGYASQEDLNQISKFLENPEFPEYLKAMIISSLFLGNISYFHPESFEIFLSQLENCNSLIVKARSIIAIVLLSLLHPKRISGNLKCRSRLILMAEDDEFKRLYNEVIFNIVRTFDTQRIDKKMRNEVIPGLMKIKPEIIDKIRNITSDSEDFLSDGNPQWDEMIENSEIGEKLREINDMQMEGGDVMVTAFSNLKGFPFFNNVSNWFLPFTPGHYEFISMSIEKDENTVKRLTTVMCDSDLHSFLLSIGSMPQDKRKQMIGHMKSQINEAYEALSNSIEESEKQLMARIIRHSLQDLYRFFKFYKKKNDFEDPFKNAILYSNIEPLLMLFGIGRESLNLVAEFYFKNKYYDEAVGFFESIAISEPENYNIWEKIGYIHDRMQRYEEAIKWYKKAEILNPDNPWLVKRLALSLKNAGLENEALKYYEKALFNDPENYHLLMSAGQCRLAIGDIQEALNNFYHAHYLEPHKLDPLRAVAWGELIAGHHDKAKAQYQKILNDPNMDKTDFLNAAHAALSEGDLKNAIQLYSKFVDLSPDKDITNLVLAFRDDSDIMKKMGIKTSDLRLIVDKIRYDLLK